MPGWYWVVGGPHHGLAWPHCNNGIFKMTNGGWWLPFTLSGKAKLDGPWGIPPTLFDDPTATPTPTTYCVCVTSTTALGVLTTIIFCLFQF